MNKEGHVLNAVLLSVGLGFILQPAGDVRTFTTIAEVTIPITLGALFPDVDTAFGSHRKTFHNLLVFATFLLYPALFGNLQYVWVGILTHYLLDVLGTTRGIALFYPWPEEYGLPVGVSTSSPYANVVTLTVTGLELGLAAGVVFLAPEFLPQTLVDGALTTVGV